MIFSKLDLKVSLSQWNENTSPCSYFKAHKHIDFDTLRSPVLPFGQFFPDFSPDPDIFEEIGQEMDWIYT